MAICLEFGEPIGESACGERMVALSGVCVCARCGLPCAGRHGACASVWASGVNGIPTLLAPGVVGPVEGAACVSAHDGSVAVAVAVRPVEPLALVDDDVAALADRLERVETTLVALTRAVSRLVDTVGERTAEVRAQVDLIGGRISGIVGGPSLSELMDRLDEVERVLGEAIAVRNRPRLQAERPPRPTR